MPGPGQAELSVFPHLHWLLVLKEHQSLCARQAGADTKTIAGAGLRVQPGCGGIFKTAAVAILRTERRLMGTAEITKCALLTAGRLQHVAHVHGWRGGRKLQICRCLT